MLISFLVIPTCEAFFSVGTNAIDRASFNLGSDMTNSRAVMHMAGNTESHLSWLKMKNKTARENRVSMEMTSMSGVEVLAFDSDSDSDADKSIVADDSNAGILDAVTLFDFTGTESNVKSIEGFERIDDAIMGGISTSSLKEVDGKPYASWSGVCRTDGGGFCGMRTLPFTEPLRLSSSTDGIFVDCRLASDNEPERRIWKTTVRTDSSRGELVYQSQFQIPKTTNEEEFARVIIPFDSFRQVRGPRLVLDGPKFNVTGGLYQIGMTMSKFVMGTNTTLLENFRPGYFNLHLERIGAYSESKTTVNDSEDAELVLSVPVTVSKDEAQRQRPIILKLVLPVAKLLFNEKVNRRKSAMKILMEKRGLSRFRANLFAVRSRAANVGLIPAVLRASVIIFADAMRIAIQTLLKVCLLYPLVTISRTTRFMKKNIFKMQIDERNTLVN